MTTNEMQMNRRTGSTPFGRFLGQVLMLTVILGAMGVAGWIQWLS